jgi:hypothetical protein
MRKFLFLSGGGLLFVCLASTSWAQNRQPVFPGDSSCDPVKSGLWTDLANGVNYEGQVSGPDEPALLFDSNRPG